MRVQSFSDVVTNSSSEIFQCACHAEGLKRLINGILDAAGTAKRCDELFDITTRYDIDSIYDGLDYYLSAAEEHMDDPDVAAAYRRYEKEIGNAKTENSALQALYDVLVDKGHACDLQGYAENDGNYDCNYVIKRKDGVDDDTLGIVNRLFNYWVNYDC